MFSIRYQCFLSLLRFGIGTQVRFGRRVLVNGGRGGGWVYEIAGDFDFEPVLCSP